MSNISVRYDYIDALRGLAILGVIAAHTADRFEIYYIGSFGVQLFFIVSAFSLINSMNYHIATEKSPIRNFYIRRFFRIAPAFYLAAVFYLFLNGRGASFWSPRGIEDWQILITGLFFHGWHPESINLVVPGGWSIADEVMFYMIFPILFICIRNSMMAMLAAILALSFAFLLNYVLYPVFILSYGDSQKVLIDYYFQLWFPAQFPIFIFGFFLYYFSKLDLFIKFNPRVGLYFLVIFLVLISALTKVGNPRFITPTFLFGVSFLFLFLGLAIYPTKLLVNKAICYLGRISFSIYLIHFAVIKLLNPFLKTLMLPGLESTMLFMGTLVISCAIASLLYRYVETVGQEFGRGFIKRLENS